MLQTGALIRDLSVRELVTMVASLYPAPLSVDDALELAGISDLAPQRTNRRDIKLLPQRDERNPVDRLDSYLRVTLV